MDLHNDLYETSRAIHGLLLQTVTSVDSKYIFLHDRIVILLPPLS